MKLERVVVGIDFSPSSIDAARWVGEHFASGAEIILLHAISIPAPPPIVRSRYARHDLLLDTVREGAEKKLRDIIPSLGAERVRIELREGPPLECLTAVAEELSADLVVAGTHGERLGLSEGLGSTAEHLVRTSGRPVLMVAEPRASSPKSILVPIDNPDHAANVSLCASMFGQRFDAQVTALHVATGGMASSALAALAVVSGTPPIDVDAMPHANEPLARWIESTMAAGLPREQANSEVVTGDAPHEILDAAARLDADLIIMGRRDAGNLRRAVLGSVVEAVLRAAPCPVLVVPEPTAH